MTKKSPSDRRLSVVGHLGWDCVDRSPGPIHESLGGALWHFLNGYALLGGPVLAHTWTTAEVHDLATAALLGSGVDWSHIVIAPEAPRFTMWYDQADPGRLDRIEVEIPSPPDFGTLLKDIAGLMNIHICTMPFSDILAVLHAVPETSGQRVSLQLHESIMPTAAEWLNAAPVERALVFLSRQEFILLTGLGEPLPLVLPPPWSHYRWIVTSPSKIMALGPGWGYSFPIEKLEPVVDVTGAGDVFAGAFLSLLDKVPLAAVVKYASGIVGLKLQGYSSSVLTSLYAHAFGRE